jgi:hypothetical protein
MRVVTLLMVGSIAMVIKLWYAEGRVVEIIKNESINIFPNGCNG